MWKENHLYENSIEHLGKNDKGNQLKDAIKLAVRETNVKTVKISYKSSSLNSKYSESLLRSCSLFKKLLFIYLSSISSMGLVSLQLSASAPEEERTGRSETIPWTLRAATLEEAAAALGTGGDVNGTLRVEQCAAWAAVHGAPTVACQRGFSLSKSKPLH